VSESVSQSVTQQLLRRKENISSHHRHDQIKEDETGGACSMHGRDECILYLSCKTLKGTDNLENLGVDGKIIL